MDKPDRLGKYQIQSILGQGAMGVVYKGFDPVIGRTVALKTIRKGVFAVKDLEPMLNRLKHEAQAAGRLAHPGIITVYEYGEEGETAFIAMEYVQGRELAEILDQGERPDLATAIDIVNQLLDILAYFHTHGVVHRDIKPGNILIPADGRIKVADFGIAKIESSDLTQFGDVLGTPSYMSPEQYEGLPVDRRSDLFSVGVLLYHLLTGEKPFPGATMATIMQRVLNTDPPKVSELNGQLPASLDQVVAKALAKKADDRFQNAEEFSAALHQACLGHAWAHDPVEAGPLFSRDHLADATVALTAADLNPSPPPRSVVDPSKLPVEAVTIRRWLLLATGLIILALAAAWWGNRIFDHTAESRHDAAPTPASPAPAVPATEVIPDEKPETAAILPAKASPIAAIDHRRPKTSKIHKQAPPAKEEASNLTVKAGESKALAPPPEPILAPSLEPAPPPPPVATASRVNEEQVSPALTPVEATKTAPPQAIKSPPGLGRKLREDEW